MEKRRSRATRCRSRRTKLHHHRRDPAGARASLCSSPIDPPEQNLPPTCHLAPPQRRHATAADRRRPCAIYGSLAARPAVRTARYVHHASSGRRAPPSDRVARRTGHASRRLSNTKNHPSLHVLQARSAPRWRGRWAPISPNRLEKSLAPVPPRYTKKCDLEAI